MPPLSPIAPRKLIKILQSHGFLLLRVHGNHHFFQDDKGHTTVVPVHAGEDIGKKLLAKILRDTGLKASDLQK